MKNLITIVICLVGFASFSQTQKEKYANQLFEQLAYLEASDVYSDIAEKQIKRNEVDINILIRAAESSYLCRKYEASHKYYSAANNIESLTGLNLNRFIDCSLRAGNYQSLNEISLKFPELADGNGMKLDQVKSYHEELERYADEYEINEFGHNSDEGDYSAFLAEDKIYFSSSRNGLGYTHDSYSWDGTNYTNVFVLDSLNAPKPNIVNSVMSELHDGPLYIDVESGKAFLSRTEFIKRGKKEVKHVKLYITDYNSGEFGPWIPFKHNNPEYNVGHAALSSDGQTLYFASDMPGGFGGSDLYKSILVNGEWSDPVNLGEGINTSGEELFPFVDEYDMLYFSSNGYYGIGGLDIYKIQIEGIDRDKPENLGAGVNSSMDDFSLVLDEDGSFGYFSSDRGESAIDRIYSVKIKPITGTLLVTAKDLLKDKKIDDVEMYLVDLDTGDSTLITMNSAGLYEIPVQNRRDYIIVGAKKDYESEGPIYLNTDNLRRNESIEKDLMFTQTHYDIKVKTVVKGTDEVCPNVSGTFIDPVTGEEINFVTDINGVAMVNIENHHDYEVIARKKGYLDLNDFVHTDASVLIELDLKMQEIKEDVTFEIKNILYDLAKWYLRPESMVELDKLVEFLKVNDNIRVELSSHTDSRASRSYNQTLSQKRAQSCVDYLIDHGIDASRIVAKGYGESKLLNECSDGVECSEEEHQRNRRTEIKILSVD